MLLRRIGFLLLIALLGASSVVAQDSAESQLPLPPPATPPDLPCAIDAHLSLWLAQESIDRTIASLEHERRDLAGTLATMLRALDLLARADNSDGVPLAEVGALAQAQAAGREALDDTYAEIQNRLVDIDKTLKRRRKQQAMLEARIEAVMESSATESGEPG